MFKIKNIKVLSLAIALLILITASLAVSADNTGIASGETKSIMNPAAVNSPLGTMSSTPTPVPLKLVFVEPLEGSTAAVNTSDYPSPDSSLWLKVRLFTAKYRVDDIADAEFFRKNDKGFELLGKGGLSGTPAKGYIDLCYSWNVKGKSDIKQKEIFKAKLTFKDGVFLEATLNNLNLFIKNSAALATVATPIPTLRPTQPPPAVDIAYPFNGQTINLTFNDIPGKSNFNGTAYSKLSFYTRQNERQLASADLMVCKNGNWYSIGANYIPSSMENTYRDFIYNWNLSNFDISNYELFEIKITDIKGVTYYTKPIQLTMNISVFHNPTPTPTPVPAPTTPGVGSLKSFAICGYVNPDFMKNDVNDPNCRAGFKVEFEGLNISTLTDSEGFFKLVFSFDYYIKIKISKKGFLTRTLTGLPHEDCKLGSKEHPLVMLAGDVAPMNGSQDGAVNMNDIMAISAAFNATAGSPLYNAEYDFNMDDSINMLDIILSAVNFGKTTGNYDPPVITKEMGPYISFNKPKDNAAVTGGSIIDLELSASDEDKVNKLEVSNIYFGNIAVSSNSSLSKSYKVPGLFSNYPTDSVPFEMQADATDEAKYKSSLVKTINIYNQELEPHYTNPRATPTPTPAAPSPTPTITQLPYDAAYAKTLEASGISYESATLRSEIGIRGNTLNLSYEYWQTNVPEIKTTVKSETYSSGDKSLFTVDELQIKGLKPGTEYSYRTVYTSYAYGMPGPTITSTGTEKTFRTRLDP